MQYENRPVIGHQGYIIRGLSRADMADWYAYLSQVEVYQHTSWNLSSVADLLPSFDGFESTHADSAIRFAIAQESTNQLVGTVGLHTVSSLNRTAELSYDLAPQVWGCGLGTACARATIDWAMRELQLNRLQATVLPSNLASIKVIERCGMQFEGTLRKFRMVRGTPMDFRLYSIVPPN